MQKIERSHSVGWFFKQPREEDLVDLPQDRAVVQDFPETIPFPAVLGHEDLPLRIQISRNPFRQPSSPLGSALQPVTGFDLTTPLRFLIGGGI